MSRNQTRETRESRADYRFRIGYANAAARLDTWLDTQPGITDAIRRLAHRRLKAAAATDLKSGKWSRALSAARAEARRAPRP